MSAAASILRMTRALSDVIIGSGNNHDIAVFGAALYRSQERRFRRFVESDRLLAHEGKAVQAAVAEEESC